MKPIGYVDPTGERIECKVRKSKIYCEPVYFGPDVDEEIYRLKTRQASGVAELVEALEEFLNVGCHVCLGDCSFTSYPVTNCPTLMARTALARYRGES